MSHEAGLRIISALRDLPNRMEQALETNDAVRRLAGKYAHAENFLYLGRQYNFPTALEGALQAQGDQLHSRRGLPGSGNEARSHCSRRPAYSERVHHAARLYLRQSDVEPGRDQGPAAARLSRLPKKETIAWPTWPTT